MKYLKLPLFRELDLRRIIMVKLILRETNENSRIYKSGFILSPLKLNKEIEIKHKGDKK